MRSLTPPVDNRNTAGEIDPNVHGKSGPSNTSLAAQQVSTDNLVLQGSQQLSSEFSFKLDYNSGNTICIGEVLGPPPVNCAKLKFPPTLDTIHGSAF
ncbi:hypothetical protein BYT27DRAFT_7125001 [Phlegmacium glaucopus]|nr:hypothetical protein BYT27DRAFT_7125001 [Phlegmacium glaucopus]